MQYAKVKFQQATASVLHRSYRKPPFQLDLEDGWAIVRNDKDGTGGQDELSAVVATEAMADALLEVLNK